MKIRNLKSYLIIAIIFLLVNKTFTQNIKITSKNLETSKKTITKNTELKFDDINKGWTENLEKLLKPMDNKNYQNPSSPTPILSFQTPKYDSLSISLLNVEGELLSELYRGTLKVGIHKLDFSNYEFNSGIYIVMINIEDKKYYKKCVLIK